MTRVITPLDMPVTIDPAWTVRDVVQRYPASIAVFKAFRVEACCDAGRSLDEAAARAGVTGAILIGALESALQEPA